MLLVFPHSHIGRLLVHVPIGSCAHLILGDHVGDHAAVIGLVPCATCHGACPRRCHHQDSSYIVQEPVSEPLKRGISAALRCTLIYGRGKVCSHYSSKLPLRQLDGTLRRARHGGSAEWRGTIENDVAPNNSLRNTDATHPINPIAELDIRELDCQLPRREARS